MYNAESNNLLALPNPYLSYRDFLQQRYGTVLHRIPLDFGFGCPNRDANGRGGCSFCAVSGGRAQQISHAESIEEQVRAGIDFARRRYAAKQFTAYIQAFTGTFAPASKQRHLYRQLLQQFTFTAVHIGTRPDCLAPKTLEFLQELQQSLDVWVELGVQTVHDSTLTRLNRGHDWQCSLQAIERLHAAGINIGVHCILGLPGETPAHFRATAVTLGALPIDAIKIHNLHVLHGSDLAAQYQQQPFPVYNEYEYSEILIEFLQHLPPQLPIMRICTDSVAAEIVAPHWQMSKGEFQQHVCEQMQLRQLRQGDCYRRESEPAGAAFSAEPIVTADGSMTLWNPLFKEHYHAPVGAYSEALNKYIEPAQLTKRLQAGNVRLLDIGFGLGYNSLCACNVAAAQQQNHHLEIIALEMDRGALRQAAAYMSTPADALFDWQQMLLNLADNGYYEHRRFSVRMLWGDARHTIKTADGLFDLVFHDPFSTQRNSELWTVQFFASIRNCMAAEALLLTYCTALPVWAGMHAAGLAIGKVTAAGAHRQSTMAARDARLLPEPLTTAELCAITASYRGIAYNDPDNIWRNKQILRHRQQQVEAAKKESA